MAQDLPFAWAIGVCIPVSFPMETLAARPLSGYVQFRMGLAICGLMYASFTQSWACDPQRQHPALQKRLLSLVSVAPRCCTGTLAALCFVIGSLLGSALGESRWSPELMDFTQPGPTLHKKITDVMPPNVDFAGPFVFLCFPPGF